MSQNTAPPCWESFQNEAEVVGLNLRLVLTRQEVEHGFGPPPGGEPRQAPARGAREGADEPSAAAAAAAALHPTYRSAVLLGSAGKPFWDSFQRWLGRQENAPRDPMDRYTEQTLEPLLALLRSEDSAAVAAYPFSHPTQIVPFLGFLEGASLMRILPFGVAVHPTMGPWYAWRAVVLTSLSLPPGPGQQAALDGTEACARCPAPCVAVCPVGAVNKGGFLWQKCAAFRTAETTCRSTCLARVACPVGVEFRYGKRQMAFHYRASLNMIEAMGAAGPK